MNNLLKTISESPFRASLPEADLKLLLSSVSEVRSQDAKAADSFYASLESVLVELRTVTPDNRDAEAFLKPVSKTDYPDYHDLIEQPMDLGTMMKHVKARKYKSKQEFQVDLDLIWKNCFQYNSGPDHILRGCATRLKSKAEHLLAMLSDRPDRIVINGLPTPPAPPSSSASSRDSPFKPIKINGTSNGIPLPRPRIPTPVSSPPRATLTPPTPGPSNSKSPHSVIGSVTKPSPPRIGGPVPFEDQPAIIRTPQSMKLFLDLDRQVQDALDDSKQSVSTPPMMSFDTKGKGKAALIQKLQDLVEDDMDIDGEHRGAENGHAAGPSHKRKRFLQSLDQRKRQRIHNQYGNGANGKLYSEELDNEVYEEDILDSWWDATASGALLASGVPALAQYDDVDGPRTTGKAPRLRPSAALAVHPKGKKRKAQNGPKKPSKPLLKLMNKNIATLTRIRKTHAKFVKLNALNSNPESSTAPLLPPEPESDHEPDDEALLREKGWKVHGEVNQPGADACLNWMGSKVLQHAGFQGTSSVALNVLTSVASEYLQNVGRTIRFLSDKYAQTMSAEEIILHTLFEGGIAETQDLEKYIKDDVIRYGGRLGDLEKKLVGAYREVTSVDAPDYEGMLEDGEGVDEFASGGLTDILGGSEDFLGLRELGIEAEFGLKSLSIPKRLWRGKAAGADRSAPDHAHAKEPPLPYPLPAVFIPLESSKVDSQIGLLKNFYVDRFKALAPPAHPPPLGAPPEPSAVVTHASSSSGAPITHSIPSNLILPDDPPNPARMKLAPLGAVIATNPAASSSKKKGKAKELPDKPVEKEAEDPSPAKKKDTKKKKAKEDNQDVGTEDALANSEVNGTGPKKKPKSSGNKKGVNGTKPIDIPPTIIASA